MPLKTTSGRSAAIVLLGMGGLMLTTPDSMAQQGNVAAVQRAPQNLVQQRSGSDVVVSQGNGAQVQRRTQQQVRQDVQRRERDARSTAQTTRRQVQQALQRDAQEQARPAAAPETASGVDDRPLWNLLRARRLMQFDQNLAALRKQHPDWTPSAALLAERGRQQQDADIESAFSRADADDIGQALQKYPEQFSCARIDRLWRAAEVLARADRKEQALALYRSVFPDCTPAANRIVTLYMAQQNLGADSDGVTQLIAVEAQSGKRDPDSDSKFTRLQYDRDLTRLAALAPESDDGLQLAQQMAPQIDAYRDSAAATLSGWIMLAHQRSEDAESWFLRARDWSPNSVDAQLGLLQIRLDKKDLAASEAILKQVLVAADPRAKPQSARLSMLRADALNQQKDFAASLRALDDAERLGASAQQTAQLRGWNLYGLGKYEQSSALFAAQYRSKHDAASAEGWALSEGARGRLVELSSAPEAQESPLQDYLTALQSQQLYYRKQFVDAYVLQRKTEQSVQQLESGNPAMAIDLKKSLPSYLPQNLKGIDAASVTSGFTFSNHAGADGQGHLETFAPSIRGEWIDGTRQYNLRFRKLMLDAGTVGAPPVAQAIGVPANYRASGKVSAQDLWFAIDDSIWLTSLGRLSWQAALGATDGGAGGTDVHGQFSIAQQTAWGSWSTYAGSNPVRDSLLSWRGMRLPGSDQWWGDVRRNAIGARALWQATPDWSISAGAELAQFNGRNVQNNKAASLDLGAGYNLKWQGFDYFNVGPALHYLHYDNNQNHYDWGLGGYYSPQRSVSAGIASQFLTLEGRDRQWSGNLELGWNSSSESASSCLPLALSTPYASVNRSAINCGYSGSSDSGMYAHLQLAVVKQIGTRWQIGAQGDLNVTPGRDRQYAAMLFLRYFFSDRGAVFSRDLPKNTRDFYGQLDDGR
ncbi:cellulose synthase subunit BcsC-related outer membrane protein [Herbaspirillum rhizosphaerae]|uniref:cellulose synthase subunit BcsC-related outer membrane protein n=1 Tax=Herbaspirillum rhizosphaerae TaxID=346179 RepID=UPI00067B0F64|nr:cellulose synthase subunit BcsC-related outer membrane protein [Herbaspirillum rhizosphaerae]